MTEGDWDLRRDLLEARTPRGSRQPHCTALHLACQGPFNAGERVVQILLREGANLRATDHRGLTPIMIAADTDATPQFRLLVQQSSRSDLEMKNDEGKSVWDLVSRPGAPHSIRRALDDIWGRWSDSSTASSSRRRTWVSDVRREPYTRRGREWWTCR